jgi:hypothetical protein
MEACSGRREAPMPPLRLKTLGFAAALSTMALLGVASASASSTRASQGDAQAVFEAGGNAGAAILLHSGKPVGPAANAPADGIRITAFVDGLHYCALDWHVIAVTMLDGNAPGESRSPSEIANDLASFTVHLDLDGVPLETVRTPVKPFLNPSELGLVNAFFSTTGRVLAPEELPVGPHTLHTETTDPAGNIFFPSTVGFVIDAPGTGTCL